MWLLKVNAPDKEAQQLQLKPGTLTVGRLSTNEIVIDDVAASRRHAEITLDPFTDTVRVVDLGSTNGTYVNRQRLTDPVTLQSGDVIRIGQVTMYLSQQVDEAETSAQRIGHAPLHARTGARSARPACHSVVRHRPPAQHRHRPRCHRQGSHGPDHQGAERGPLPAGLLTGF